jgi:preprotein translocase subunit SecD
VTTQLLFLTAVAALTLSAPASIFEIHAVEGKSSVKTQAYPIENGGRKATVNLNNDVLIDRTALLSATSIVETTGAKNDRRSVAMLKLTFTTDGLRKFTEVTTAQVGKQVGVLIDGKLIATPTVREALPGNSIMLTGNFSKEEADAMAAKIKSGK